MVAESPILDTWADWKQVASGELCIEDHLPVSRASKFGDDIWNFLDLNNPRTLTINPGALRVEWYHYESVIPTALMRSIKVLGFFYVHCPMIFNTSRRASKHGFAPSTYCHHLNSVLSFFAEICIQSQLPVMSGNTGVYIIKDLSDISLHSIKNALPTWNRKSQWRSLKSILIAFTNPIIQRYLPGFSNTKSLVQWNANDLKYTKFESASNRSSKSKSFRDKPISDELFAFMTRTASHDVLQFLTCLGKQVSSDDSIISPDFPHALSGVLDFKSSYLAYKDFVGSKYIGNVERINAGKSRSGFAKLVLDYNTRFVLTTTEIQAIIFRVQNAAKYLVLQFTGMRFSEGALLRKGCISRLVSGDYVIKSTLIKNQSVNSITGLDYWVACPIVRDAVSVLEEIAYFNNSNYLLTANVKHSSSGAEIPIKGGVINVIMTTYLYDIDINRRYSEYVKSAFKRFASVRDEHKITVHRLRHTLALHMSRAGLGIPYISFHLKHVYQAHRRLQSLQDVTLGYGNIGSDVFQNAIGIAQANREIINSIYHPNAIIAGPGAALFKQKRAYFFTGMLAAGWEFDEVMEYLASRGLIMADVGLGYCQGRQEIEEDGKKELPPCLGQLKCNPNKCKNAVIPQSKALIWQQVYKENRRRLSDPLMMHAKDEYLGMMAEAEQVLVQLGIQVEQL